MWQLSPKALALTAAILWGGSILFVGVVNLATPPYGAEFLNVASSIYPGFHASRTLPDVLIGAAYGFVDGAVGGLLVAWLYNLFARPKGIFAKYSE